MIDSTMRKLKDWLLMSLSRTPLFKMKPNTITTISFLFGLASAGFIYKGYLKTAFILFVLNRIVDGLDGLVARQTDRQSDFGGYYDILTDFVIYSLIPLAIAFRRENEQIWILTAVLLAVFYVNGASWMFLAGLLEKPYYRESLNNHPTSLVMPRGLVEGTETILIYSFMILLPSFQIWYLAGMGILTFIGIPQRIIFARKFLK